MTGDQGESQDHSLRDALAGVAAGERLGRLEVSKAIGVVLAGKADPTQLAGFLAALAQRGETAEEIAGVAAAMRSAMTPFEHGEANAIDTCGTGGDGLGTFNISTAAALVAAGAGAKVVKHGNRSVSSKSGSADVLESLGGVLDVHDDVGRRALSETGFTFLYAPRYHPAMRFAAPVRKALGIRTVFNLVGPLANPGGVKRQVLGVPSSMLQGQLADALTELGVDAAFVVHGDGGADELTLGPQNRVTALGSAAGRDFDFSPAGAGVQVASVDELSGGDSNVNARMMRDVLGGEDGPVKGAVILNAAAALIVAGLASTVRDAADMARESIESKAAQRTLEGWVRITSEGAA